MFNFGDGYLTARSVHPYGVVFRDGIFGAYVVIAINNEFFNVHEPSHERSSVLISGFGDILYLAAVRHRARSVEHVGEIEAYRIFDRRVFRYKVDIRSDRRRPHVSRFGYGTRRIKMPRHRISRFLGERGRGGFVESESALYLEGSHRNGTRFVVEINYVQSDPLGVKREHHAVPYLVTVERLLVYFPFVDVGVIGIPTREFISAVSGLRKRYEAVERHVFHYAVSVGIGGIVAVVNLDAVEIGFEHRRYFEIGLYNVEILIPAGEPVTVAHGRFGGSLRRAEIFHGAYRKYRAVVVVERDRIRVYRIIRNGVEILRHVVERRVRYIPVTGVSRFGGSFGSVHRAAVTNAVSEINAVTLTFVLHKFGQFFVKLDIFRNKETYGIQLYPFRIQRGIAFHSRIVEVPRGSAGRLTVPAVEFVAFSLGRDRGSGHYRVVSYILRDVVNARSVLGSVVQIESHVVFIRSVDRCYLEIAFDAFESLIPTDEMSVIVGKFFRDVESGYLRGILLGEITTVRYILERSDKDKSGCAGLCVIKIDRESLHRIYRVDGYVGADIGESGAIPGPRHAFHRRNYGNVRESRALFDALDDGLGAFYEESYVIKFRPLRIQRRVGSYYFGGEVELVIESGFFVPAVECVTVPRGRLRSRNLAVFRYGSALHFTAVTRVESDGVTPHRRIGGFDVDRERSRLFLIFYDHREVLLFSRGTEIEYPEIVPHVRGENHIFSAVRTGDVELDTRYVELFADEVFGLVFAVLGDGYTDDFDSHAGSESYRGQNQ